MALTRGIGKLLQIGVAVESTRGTAKTSAQYWLAVDDWAIEEKFANAVDTQVYGRIEDNVSQTRVKDWAEGSIKCPLGGTTAAVIFRSLLGSSAAVLKSGETKIFDNYATVAQNIQHPSLTLFIHDPIATATGATADYSHANAMVNKVSIDYSLGNFVMMDVGVRAIRGSAAAVAFVPSQVVETRFVPQYMSFKVASAYASNGLTNAAVIRIKNAKITIDQNIEDDDTLGNTAPRDFLNKEFSIEGTIEAIWQNESDFKDAAIANTPKAMRLDITNSDVTEGVSSNPKLRIDLARVHFTEISRPVKIKDVMYQTLGFKAAYSVTDGFMVQAIFTNSVNIGSL